MIGKLETLLVLLHISIRMYGVCQKSIHPKKKKHKRWKNRKHWVRPMFKKRKERGFFTLIYPLLKHNKEMFFRFTRMNYSTFCELLKLVGSYLIKSSRRTPIAPNQRLLLTLRYLATGDLPLSLAVTHLMGESTVLSIIKETTRIIAEILSPLVLKCPSSDEWMEIGEGFKHRWNMPNCIGAIDGKHVVINAPANSGSIYHNYKKKFSIVLMAVCDHNYQFTLVDIGAYGSESDGGIFHRSEFGRSILEEELNIPRQLFYLPGADISTPYYLVGDDAFAISTRMMRPYPRNSSEMYKKIFNYRESRARRIIENTFAILCERWLILQPLIGIQVETVDWIVYASVCLHNFLMKRKKLNKNRYFSTTPINCEDIIEDFPREPVRAEKNKLLKPISTVRPCSVTKEGHQIRDDLAGYFLTPQGEVPWQHEYITRGRNSDHLMDCFDSGRD